MPGLPVLEYLTQWATHRGMQPPVILVAPASNPDTEIVITDTKYAAACTTGAAAPCRTCAACRSVQHNTHPDSIDLAPEGASWRIADIRRLRGRLARASLSPTRLVVLRQVERCHGPTAAALLKMLEEPAASTRYLLVTAWPRRLLPTILSRCQLLRLPYHAVPVSAPSLSLEVVQQKISRKKGRGFTDEEVAFLAQLLAHQLQVHGPSAPLRRAFMRLRDYYLITSRNGNSQLAGETLVLSASALDGMS